MAIEDNLAGPTKHKGVRLERAFLCLEVYLTIELVMSIEKQDRRLLSKTYSLGSSAKACRHNFISRLFRFVIGHFCGESWRTDIKSGRVLETPNNVGR
jgi:hypothetical protein